METPKSHPHSSAKLFTVLPLTAALVACGGSSSSDSNIKEPKATPGVSSVNPVDNATKVDRSQEEITAQFDKDIFATTVDSTSFTLAADNPVAGTVSFDGATNTASFTPASDLSPLVTYTATLKTDITDLSGTAMAAPYIWSFTTADGSWGTADLVETDSGDAENPQIAFDGSGNAWAVWSQSDGAREGILASHYTEADGWSTAELIVDSSSGTATKPQIAIGGDGNALAVWQLYDGTDFNIRASRYTEADGWDTEESVESTNGNAFNPQIAFDNNGNALAVWQHYNGSFFNMRANRYAVGTGWGTEEVIDDNTGDAQHPRIAFDNNGNALAVWYQSDGTDESIRSNRYTETNGWGTAELIGTKADTAKSPRIAFDNSGNALAVWYQNDGVRDNIYANRYTETNGWGTAELIENNDAGGALHPRIAFDNSGNALAIWPQSDGSHQSMWANRYTEGGWGTPELIETNDNDESLFSDIAFDDKGNALAVWQRHDGNPGSPRNIWSNRYTVAHGWGTAELIEAQATDNAKYPKVAFDGKGNALAIWQQDDSADTNIRANRFE